MSKISDGHHALTASPVFTATLLDPSTLTAYDTLCRWRFYLKETASLGQKAPGEQKQVQACLPAHAPSVVST